MSIRHTSQMNDPHHYAQSCKMALEFGQIKATYFRRGAIVTGWPSRWPSHFEKKSQKRGIVRNATVRSLIRAGWNISNSPSDWELLTTLTFRDAPCRAKDSLRRWCRSMVESQVLGRYWGWVQEFQDRGVIHYHVLHTLEDAHQAAPACDLRWERVFRGKKPTDVLRGPHEEFLAETWLWASRQSSMDARRFNFGGITERIRNPGAAGYYLGNYVRKIAQKTLPPGEVPQGRWWWLTPACKPVATHEAILKTWPFETPHHLVFDATRIGGNLDQSNGREAA